MGRQVVNTTSADKAVRSNLAAKGSTSFKLRTELSEQLDNARPASPVSNPVPGYFYRFSPMSYSRDGSGASTMSEQPHSQGIYCGQPFEPSKSTFSATDILPP
ncbi:hypothetical protein OIU78_010399 [Salix suchowensis]|nr:hypothetical protein OIU78_010399 [Salix suchowensis]